MTTNQPIATRYPYTYAADYIRSLCDTGEYGEAKISRREAAHIYGTICHIAGVEKEVIAKRLADLYLTKRAES